MNPPLLLCRLNWIEYAHNKNGYGNIRIRKSTQYWSSGSFRVKHSNTRSLWTKVYFLFKEPVIITFILCSDSVIDSTKINVCSELSRPVNNANINGQTHLKYAFYVVDPLFPSVFWVFLKKGFSGLSVSYRIFMGAFASLLLKWLEAER